MLVVPEKVRARYGRFLQKNGVVGQEQYVCQKWLRFYLDFCSKYSFAALQKSSLEPFMYKLQQKNQSEQKRSQAKRAVGFYYEFLSYDEKCSRSSIEKERKIQIDNDSGSSLVECSGPRPASPVRNFSSEEFKPLCIAEKCVDKTGDRRSGGQSGCSWKDQFEGLENAIALRHYSKKTLRSYRNYVTKFQAFTKSIDPGLLDSTHVKDFLTYLAVEKKVAASTQNLAFNSLLFFFRHVLNKEFGEIEGVVRAKRKPYIPVVLSRDEVDELIAHLEPPCKLVVQMLYGCGLRLFECLNLRVQCLNFDAGCVTVHDGKGKKDRTVPLPVSLVPELRCQLQKVKQLHKSDLDSGYKGVFLVNALERKYKSASREFIWQWLFPAYQLTRERESGERRRYHLHETHVQKAIRQAVNKTTLTKRVTAHTFRHTFASHLLQNNYDIRTIQKLLGHSDVRTTMIYTHTVPSRTIKEVASPLDF